MLPWFIFAVRANNRIDDLSMRAMLLMHNIRHAIDLHLTIINSSNSFMLISDINNPLGLNQTSEACVFCTSQTNAPVGKSHFFPISSFLLRNRPDFTRIITCSDGKCWYIWGPSSFTFSFPSAASFLNFGALDVFLKNQAWQRDERTSLRSKQKKKTEWKFPFSEPPAKLWLDVVLIIRFRLAAAFFLFFFFFYETNENTWVSSFLREPERQNRVMTRVSLNEKQTNRLKMAQENRETSGFPNFRTAYLIRFNFMPNESLLKKK